MSTPVPRPRRLKTIGILGGMSDTATAEYYRLINQAVNVRLGGWDIAETLIQGVNFGNIEHFIRNGLWDEAGEYLAVKAQGAERGGADVLICASNTLHRVSERFMRGLHIPFIHIADATGQAIRAAGLNKVGLLGTRSVMSSPYFPEYYSEKHGISVVTPDAEGRTRVDAIIFDELVRRVMNPESKAWFIETCHGLRDRGAQGVILGCTEIFLLMDQDDLSGFPVFDTSALHVQAAVDFVLGPAA
jgi:aspartate racemase